MKEDIKIIKKQIEKDWLKNFPTLNRYTSNKLYEVLGPLIIGIELLKLPRVDEYRPYFMIYSLWGNKIGHSLKHCFLSPEINQEILSLKNLPLDIAYLDHSKKIVEAINQTKNQVGFLLEKNVNLNILLKFIDYYMTNPVVLAQSSGKLANLLLLKYYLALYLNNEKYIDEVLVQFDDNRKNWNMTHFELWHGDYDNWFNTFIKIDRSKFIDIIKNNKEDKKLSKLSIYEIIS